MKTVGLEISSKKQDYFNVNSPSIFILKVRDHQTLHYPENSVSADN